MSHFLNQWPVPERQPLEGRYCRLEPLNPDRHGDDLFVVVSGPEGERLHRWLPDPVPASRHEFDDWLLSRVASADPMFFAVIDKATGRAEGRQSLVEINTTHGS